MQGADRRPCREPSTIVKLSGHGGGGSDGRSRSQGGDGVISCGYLPWERQLLSSSAGICKRSARHCQLLLVSAIESPAALISFCWARSNREFNEKRAPGGMEGGGGSKTEAIAERDSSVAGSTRPPALLWRVLSRTVTNRQAPLDLLVCHPLL